MMPMRAKVAIPLLLVGIMAVLLVLVPRPKPSAPGLQPAQATTGDSLPKTSSVGHLAALSNSSPAEPRENSTASGVATGDSADAQNGDYEVYVANRVTELEKLGMTDDPNSLAEIESEFDNRDPRIQKAAVAAAVQFGSRDAIPALQEAYQHLDDPGQKVNIQKAIDFLKLPSLGETGNAAASAGGGNSGN
jgi:hypothetical protein